jgi:hypothetical protein
MFWNELSISPVFDGGGKLVNFIGIQQDVTARKMAESALHDQNRDLRAYAEALESQSKQQKTLDERIDHLLRQSGFGRKD